MSVLHVRYTARQGGNLLAEKAIAHLRDDIEQANTSGLAQLFDLRHDFATEWHRFVTGEENFSAIIKKSHFPYFVQGSDVEVTKVTLFAINDGELLAGEALDLQLGTLNDALKEDDQFELSLAPDEQLERAEQARVFAVFEYALA